jgi:hypothetical protein
MKRIGLFLIVVLSLVSNICAKSRETTIEYDNLSTLNISNVLNEEDIRGIKYICSYDYCEFVKGLDLKKIIRVFTYKYISSIENEDIKNSLNVKGIKITKIIYEN